MVGCLIHGGQHQFFGFADVQEGEPLERRRLGGFASER